jgi:thiosulfate/3-mercaptopyruvate sulfurtransferase
MSGLISAAELATLLADPELVVLDATVEREAKPGGGHLWFGGRLGYEASHIPGARFADLFDDFSEPEAPTLFTRATPERFAQAAARLGVAPSSRIVVYDRADNIWAARLWWQFRSLGFTRVQVLDGGLTAWRAAGAAIETGAPTPARETAPYGLSEDPAFWIDRDGVLDILQGRRPGALVCALRPSVFSGAEQNYVRPGHIPGSLNAPHAATLDGEGRYRKGGALAETLSPAFDAPGPLALYCGGGIAASGLALALAEAGRADVAVYDGSLSEWSADPSLPLVTVTA